MTEESKGEPTGVRSTQEEVERARLHVWEKVDAHHGIQASRPDGDETHMSGCTCCCWDCEPVLDALEAAVRADERARGGTAIERE